MCFIYILELEEGKYYVGKTNNPYFRLESHFNSNGSLWTKKYKPIEIINKIQGDNFDEEKYTLLTMDKYGIDNVRGGSYCKVKLSKNDIDKALQTIRSLMNKCYSCGEKGHYTKECKINKVEKEVEEVDKECCSDCGGSGISYWSDINRWSVNIICLINCSSSRS